MNKILIIGGNGYIGQRLHKYLNSYYEVDSFGSKYDDYNLLTKDIITQYSHIILLAGHSSVKMCEGELRGVWNNNVRNFYNLTEKMNKEQKLIYASSSSVYGNKTNCTECMEHMCSYEFMNNYDLTKMSLDALAKSMIYDGKNIIGLRFGTVCGSSPIFRSDLMINAMTNSAIQNGCVEVMNKNVNRPILGLKDLCRSYKRIIESDFISGIYNLASFNTNVMEISKAVSNITGAEVIDRGECVTYDFSLSTSKFSKYYDLTFNETPETITNEIIEMIKIGEYKTKRNDFYFDYKG